MAGNGGDARIVGLDAWRSMLMTGGLLVHGSLALAPTSLFFLVDLISQASRMGVFFAISGFLAAGALRGTPSGTWFRRRLRQLGIPAVTGILVIAPLIWWIVATHPLGAPAELPLMFEWAHMWFLWGLLFCSAVLWALDRGDAEGRIFAAIARAKPLVLIVGTALVTALMFAITPPVMQLFLSPRVMTAFVNVQMITGYLPTFLLGVLIARHEEARVRLLGAWRIAAVIVVGTLLCHVALTFGVATPLEREIRFLGAALCPPAAFVLVLRSALSIRRVPDVVRSLTDASYTIYLLHFPVALALNTRMAPLGLRSNAQYVVTIVIAGLSCWACHVFLVKRSRALGLLLNGRLPAPRSAPALAAV